MNKRLRRGLILAGLLVILVGSAVWSSCVVHVRRADVYLDDLPKAFDGTTVLFVTDIDLVGVNNAERAARVFRKLRQLAPDMLLLGGDYASPSLFERLNGVELVDPSRADALFQAISEFKAPLGKFAICGDNDGSIESFAARSTRFGVTAIDKTIAVVQKDGALLGIAGAAGTAADIGRLASSVQHEQCVITLCHSPSRVVDIRIAESADGGAWSDLILCGHTHGGQIRCFNRTALTLDETEQSFLSGWTSDGHTSMLVSSGFGCEALNLRIGTQSEVWLITLRRAPSGITFR